MIDEELEARYEAKRQAALKILGDKWVLSKNYKRTANHSYRSGSLMMENVKRNALMRGVIL